MEVDRPTAQHPQYFLYMYCIQYIVLCFSCVLYTIYCMKKYTTFYLEEDIVERLNQEKNKSAIVNNALRVHFMMKDSKSEDIVFASTPRAERKKPKPLEDDFEPTPEQLPDTDLHNVAAKFKMARGMMKECPNGHPIPAGRDRCMGKGCKHS